MGRELNGRWVALAIAIGGCSATIKPGATVDVLIASTTSPPVRDGARVFETDRKFVVTIEKGYLTTHAVEIFPCESVSSIVRRWFERDAYAHTVGTPTRLGIPAVESLVATEQLSVGKLYPPLGSYCRIRHSIAAADDDAVALPTDISMVGKSLSIRGFVSHLNGEGRHDLTIESSVAFDVETVIAPMQLRANGEPVVIMLTKSGDHWFDGIEFDSPDEDVERRVLANIQKSLKVRVE